MLSGLILLTTVLGPAPSATTSQAGGAGVVARAPERSEGPGREEAARHAGRVAGAIATATTEPVGVPVWRVASGRDVRPRATRPGPRAVRPEGCSALEVEARVRAESVRAP